MMHVNLLLSIGCVNSKNWCCFICQASYNQIMFPSRSTKQQPRPLPYFLPEFAIFFTQIYLRHFSCLFISECFLNFASNLNSSFICSQYMFLLQCKNKMKSSLLHFLTNLPIIIILIAAPPFKLNCCLALQSSFPASTSLLVLENYVFVTERQKDKKTERKRQKDKNPKLQSSTSLNLE